MTPSSIVIAWLLAIAITYLSGRLLAKAGWSKPDSSLWAVSLGLVLGISTLLAGSLSDLTRAIWPREAVDWLGPAAAVMALAATIQNRNSVATSRRPDRLALLVGILMGIAITCRLLFGTVYLRPAQTSIQSLLAIGLAGALLGSLWYLELQRNSQRSWMEMLVLGLWIAGAALILAMSGSMQYAVIGSIIGLASLAARLATGHWPWTGQLVCAMLLGLGLAFAELQLVTLAGFAVALLWIQLAASLRARWPTSRVNAWMLLVSASLIAVLVGWTTQHFLSDLKRNSTEYGGYETLK